LYFSNTPWFFNITPQLRAVCPPKVRRMPSGRSEWITLTATNQFHDPHLGARYKRSTKCWGKLAMASFPSRQWCRATQQWRRTTRRNYRTTTNMDSSITSGPAFATWLQVPPRWQWSRSSACGSLLTSVFACWEFSACALSGMAKDTPRSEVTDGQGSINHALEQAVHGPNMAAIYWELQELELILSEAVVIGIIISTWKMRKILKNAKNRVSQARRCNSHVILCSRRVSAAGETLLPGCACCQDRQ